MLYIVLGHPGAGVLVGCGRIIIIDTAADSWLPLIAEGLVLVVFGRLFAFRALPIFL